MGNCVINPEALKSHLPDRADIDFYNNKTYVSLVAFMFKRTSQFKIPIPFLGTFEEVNLRFLVKMVEGDSINEELLLSMKNGDELKQALPGEDHFRVNRYLILHRKTIPSLSFHFNERLILKPTFKFGEQIFITKANYLK